MDTVILQFLVTSPPARMAEGVCTVEKKPFCCCLSLTWILSRQAVRHCRTSLSVSRLSKLKPRRSERTGRPCGGL